MADPRLLAAPLIVAMAAACGDCSTYEGGCLAGTPGCTLPTPCRRLELTCDSPGISVRRLGAAEAAADAGSDALGAEGDFVLENSRVRAVVAAPGSQMYLDPAGGALLDLSTVSPDGGEDANDSLNGMVQAAGLLPDDLVRYAAIRIVDAGGRAAVQADGTLFGRPQVRVHTLYEVRPCEPGIRVRTELVNESKDPLMFFLSDTFLWTQNELSPFVPIPDCGFAFPSFGLTDIDGAFRTFPFFAANAHAPPYAAYAEVACNEPSLVGVNDPTLTAAGLPKRIVGTRDFLVFERFVAAANAPDVAGAADLALEVRRQLHGEEYVTLSGRVDRPGALALGGERSVSVEISEGRLDPSRPRRPSTQAVARADGTFHARVPRGLDYYLAFHSFGRLVAEREALAVDADRDVGTVALPSTARVALRVEDPGGVGLDAEVLFLPADDTTRASAAGSFHGRFTPCAPWLGPPQGASPACNRALIRGGDATVEIPPGHYFAYAFKGPFFTLARQEVTLPPADASLAFQLAPLGLQPAGTLGADLHVHGAASYDSEIPETDRVLSFAAMDVQVVVATDHNVVTDYGIAASELGLTGALSVISGVETTPLIPYLAVPDYPYPVDVGHFNFWPLRYDPSQPRNGAPELELSEPGELMARMGSRYTGVHVVQMNHPWADDELGRDDGFARALSLNALRDLPSYDDGTNQGIFVRAPRYGLPANDSYHAQEVMNGTANAKFLQYRELWFYLLNQGRLRTGTANSDSHGLVGSTVGLPRNVVYASTPAGPGFESDAFDLAIRDGRSFGTNGPVIEATVERVDGVAMPYGLALFRPKPDGNLWLRVSAAPWVPVDEIRVVVNGRTVKTLAALPALADPFGTAGTLRYQGTVGLGELLAGISSDAWIVVEAGAALPIVGDLGGGLGGGLGGAPDGIPDTTDNNGDGRVDLADVAAGRAYGPLQEPAIPTDPADPGYHFSQVVTGAVPAAFTNPFVLDLNGNGRFDVPGLTGGRPP